MSVTIITSAWAKFHQIPKEQFTEKVMQAMAMAQLINDFSKEDLKELKWLRDNTHKKIRQSIYKLDRYVDETKGRASNQNFTFSTGTFNQDTIQEYLCLAIEEVCEIVYRNFKDYKVEQKMFIDNDMVDESDAEW